jgi:Ni/Co efflux regulator RcnB
MKRTLIAIALATVAATSFAASRYSNEAGQSEKDNVVQTQLGDASDSYRFDAGEQDQHQPQLADAATYRNNAGEQDSAQIQLG